jgi:hypothetical protein
MLLLHDNRQNLLSPIYVVRKLVNIKFVMLLCNYSSYWCQKSALKSISRNFILEFTSQFVNGVPEVREAIKCVVYKLVCESHYELLNFATKFGTFVVKVS